MAETPYPRIAGQMRRPAQRYVLIGNQVRLRMTIALRPLCSTTVDWAQAAVRPARKAGAPRRSIGAER
jgi:hypothetical protein